jgi:manganese oxidase
MISNALRPSCLLTVVILASGLVRAAEHLPTIAVNDNRSPAGQLRDGVLTISLELGEGQWHPESEQGEVLTVYAIGETGRSLQNPGPLVRVPQGTEIHATVHNALPVAATVHGLHERPGTEKDALILQPGGTQDVRFKTGEVGAYYYWVSTTGSTLQLRVPVETQLAGAFVVDPPGVATVDRVFITGVWYKEIPFHPGSSPAVATINGKSWPYAERFTFQVGETVHWRWLNPGNSSHAMHLHGFYYYVDGGGDAERHKSYNEAERPLIVTKLMEPGQTFDMTWVAERAGRWLFHCHMLIHMSPPEWKMLVERPKPGVVSTLAHEHAYPAETQDAGMGGLVLGITVVGGSEKSKSPVWRAERKLQLTLDERADAQPRYALQLRELAQSPSPSPASATAQLIGPPIVLTRDQPLEIELVNRSTQPTAIHWHGIELESYYDGVAGWTGTTQQTTPAVNPGQSFVVRMAPPRAGTFIYHTHWHDQGQLENGIYGPLIVLPPGQKFDPALDKTFLFSLGVFEPLGELLLINGHPQPAPLRLATGRKYRFRLINISPNNEGMRASLRKAGIPVQWRIIAKDGADLPPAAAGMQTAEFRITVGETYDFEFEANAPQELALEVYLPGPKLRATQGLVFAASPPGN